MTFNDERLAREVAACPVPVVTGIGHEPDTCICDMVADRRCSTPTAAAESVAPAFDEIIRSFHDRERRLAQAMSARLAGHRQAVDAFALRSSQAERSQLARMRLSVDALAAHRCLQDPHATIDDRAAQLELTAQRLHDAAPRTLARLRAQLDALEAHRCLQDPFAPLHERRETVDALGARLVGAGPRTGMRLSHETSALAARMGGIGPRLLRTHQATLARSAAQLEALSPLKVLARGYAIARDEAGHVVSQPSQVRVGDALTVLMDGGGVTTQVTGTFEGGEETFAGRG